MANQGWKQFTDPATDEYVFRRQDGVEVRLPIAAFAPDNADYLVGTSDGGLSNEIVVGTTPGGELGGTWGSPTVDTVHSGSSHADFAAGPSARNQRTAGSLTLNSTTWADVDNALDLTIAAVAGDWIEVGVGGLWGNAAVNSFLDAVSLVAGSPVNSWSMNAAPDNAHEPWQWGGVALAFHPISGTISRQVVAGDISGGNVTLRLRYKTLTAVNKILFAVSTTPLVFFAHNLKQP